MMTLKRQRSTMTESNRIVTSLLHFSFANNRQSSEKRFSPRGQECDIRVCDAGFSPSEYQMDSQWACFTLQQISAMDSKHCQEQTRRKLYMCSQ